MAQHVLKVGDQIKMANLIFRIRKISKKDVIIREVKPPIAQAQAQGRKKVAEGKTEGKTEEKAEEKATEEDLFEKTF